MKNKIFRAFARYNGELKAVYVQAKDIEIALKTLKENPSISEVLNISDQTEDTIILDHDTEVDIQRN
jgi:hypothetical protein